MSLPVAVGTRFLSDRPLAEAVEAARRQGADGVDLCAAHLALGADEPGAALASLHALLERAGLALAGVSASDWAADRAEDVPAAVSRLCEEVAQAGRLGLRRVTVAMTRGRKSEVGALLRGLQRVLTVAEAAGAAIHLANRLGSDVEQIEDVRRIVTSLRHPALRLRLDAGEFYAAAVNPRDVFAEFEDRVGSVVLSDRIGRREVPPGAGRVNLRRLVADLVRADFKGWLVVEPTVAAPGGGAGAVEYVRSLAGAAGAGPGTREES